jgi:hypothetical protein
MNADYIISKRKEKWKLNKSVNKDMELTESIANEILNDKELLSEIQRSPEKLIEMLFYVVDKEKKTVPFFMNDVQKDFINRLNKAKNDYENKKITNISLLVLKGRQQGFTTFITAYQLASTITNKNFEGFTVADSASNSESIFENKAKFTYDKMPQILKPTEKYNNRRELRFEKINSSWSVEVATKQMGRSRTINFLHASECAFWPFGIAITQASIGEALTKNSIKIYETTANGFNDYREMWYSEQHINCFYEWWKTPEYKLDFEDEETKEKFLNNIVVGNDWINKRLNWLKSEKNLNDNQLYWYFKKYNGYLDKKLIRQEYPCSIDEAFLSTGDSIFDKEIILERLKDLTPPIKRGEFEYDYNGLTISNIRWVDKPNGVIKIYQEPTKTKYTIGGDTAGDGSDNFVGQVLNATNGNQVAVLKHETDEDLYARQMFCLGKYYNNAMLAIEVNFSTFPTKELSRLGYKNVYTRETIDRKTNKKQYKSGFRTDSITRPVIIANLVSMVREHIEKFNDADTLNEFLTVVKNEKGKPEAQSGFHDDMMMAIAIGHHSRQQALSKGSVTLSNRKIF